MREGLETLTASEIEAINKRAINFVVRSLDTEWRNSLEETSPVYGLSDLISATWDSIVKIRIILLSNRILSSRVDGVAAGDLRGIPVTFNVWDLDRLHKYVLAGSEQEPIVIELAREFGGSLPALPAHLEGAGYEAYLIVIPGAQLAAIYDRWGTRLLEANVRVFLQARGAVNKGIRVTLDNDPEMFFAYNNGITATAQAVEGVMLDGSFALSRIDNLQIVNGGQTTASLHSAMVRKADLSRVFVQMKLSIIGPELATSVVPKISQYANTQNRVSAADFFSNHPFHVRMEGFSRRIFAPSPDGTFRQSKWFYERARGQYQDARGGLSPSARKAFDSEYPRSQLFNKTDLAKYAMVWEGKPDLVSKGAQKNFAAFAEIVANQWSTNSDQFSEVYFKEIVAKAIVFRSLEKLVQQQDWYSGGYRANVVAYGIAKLADDLKKRGASIDFGQLWQDQQLPDGMADALIVSAEAVHSVLTSPSSSHGNVTEWAKQQACWFAVRDLVVEWPHSLESATLSAAERSDERRQGRKDQKVLSGIEAQMAVIGAPKGFWAEVKAWGTSQRILSDKEAGILAACAKMPSRIPTEKQCLAALQTLERLQGEGLTLRLDPD